MSYHEYVKGSQCDEKGSYISFLFLSMNGIGLETIINGIYNILCHI